MKTITDNNVPHIPAYFMRFLRTSRFCPSNHKGYGIGTKNDGLIQANMARWDSDDAWTPNNHEAMYPDGNYYYGDNPDIFPNGGYNHSELRNLTRNYGQQGGSKPMDYGRQWMRERLGLTP